MACVTTVGLIPGPQELLHAQVQPKKKRNNSLTEDARPSFKVYLGVLFLGFMSTKNEHPTDNFILCWQFSEKGQNWPAGKLGQVNAAHWLPATSLRLDKEDRLSHDKALDLKSTEVNNLPRKINTNLPFLSSFLHFFLPSFFSFLPSFTLIFLNGLPVSLQP